MSDADKLAALLNTAVDQAQHDPELRTAVQPAFERIAGLVNAPLGTPSKTPSPNITIRDKFDQMGYTQGDFELARMLMGGAGQIRNQPVLITPSKEFMDAYTSRVLEGGSRPMVVDDQGRTVRAMDTQETGFGLELTGVQYVSELWQSAKNEDSLVGDIRQIPMGAPTMYVPIDGDLPAMLLVGESQVYNATPYTTSKTPTARALLTAKKFTIQSIWSGELSEDSIVAFTPWLREQVAKSAAVHVGSAFLNGDLTDDGADSNNINFDAGDLTGEEHFLAFDGIRHYWLITGAATQAKDMAGVLNPDEIWRCRGKLSAQTAITALGVKTINWGKNVRDLRLVCDFDTFMAMHRLGEVLTVDKYGPAATIVNGELGSFGGIPIISPPYAGKSLASGLIGSTEGNNTKGQITIFNPKGFISGVVRSAQLYFDRIQRTDQFLLELYTRIAFTKFGAGVAAGIYDITV